MANSIVRRFVFTLNNYTDEHYTKCCDFITSHCKYGIVGKEIGEKGTPHLQGFCNLTKPMRFNAIKQHLHNTIHIEKANGSDEDNQRYCSKAGNFFEKGSPVVQGQRSDLSNVVDRIKDGKSLTDIAMEFPTQFIRYHRGIRELLQVIKPIPPRDFKTYVYYYWGPPGSGKSKRALEEARSIDKDSIYYKPRGLWWDGYKQQKNVIIDDFYGWIKYDEMLKICDRYPYKVQVKGGFEEFTSTRLWITSNVDIYSLYHFVGYNAEAIKRRCTSIIEIK